MLTKFRNPQQKGLEVAVVLAIAAVVIWGAMTLYLSTSNQRRITDTQTLVVSAVQKVSDLYAGRDISGFNGQIAVAFGVLPESYKADTESYNLPIANAKMTFGATAFHPGPNFGIITTGPLTPESCIALGKLNLGDVVKYVTVDKYVGFTGTDATALSRQSIKDANGDIPIAAISAACEDGSYVHYFLTN
ncbi:hypothetical protein [Archangium violaceum]|uniref:hypothetical protein n=1 Tax=Archangium violaceum TaxID=83451 RepID=UPI001269CE57|nr:hypothetical protein [Archangium violaceum]